MISVATVCRRACLVVAAGALACGTAWADARIEALIARVADSSGQFHDRVRAMEALSRDAVKEAIPVLIAVMHDYDGADSEVYRTAFICRAAENLVRTAPQDPTVIDAIVTALEQERLKTSQRLERCDCLLAALERSGPAAAPRAGAIVAWFATAPPLAHEWTLPKVVTALDLQVSQAPSLIRGIRSGLAAETQTALMRALLARVAELPPGERESLHAIARSWCRGDEVRYYIVGAEALGTLGRSADVSVLEEMLRHRDYNVRRSAIRALGALGPDVVSSASALVPHVDPFLGTEDVAAEALVALGRVGAVAIEDARSRLSAQPPADGVSRVRRELLAALHAATASGNLDAFRRTLATRVRSLDGKGHYLVEVLREGAGARYAPTGLRIELSFRAFEYPRAPGAAPLEAARTRVDTRADTPVDDFYRVLSGVREGGQYRVTVGPQIGGSPYSGTSIHDSQHKLRNGFSPLVYELKVENVCRPRTVTLFPGGGIFARLEFEAWCQ